MVAVWAAQAVAIEKRIPRRDRMRLFWQILVDYADPIR
jgi:hypothetical protein